jgi:hypothetical protein
MSLHEVGVTQRAEEREELFMFGNVGRKSLVFWNLLTTHRTFEFVNAFAVSCKTRTITNTMIHLDMSWLTMHEIKHTCPNLNKKYLWL